MKRALTSLRHALYASLIGWLIGCGVLLLVALLFWLGMIVLNPEKMTGGAGLFKGFGALTGLFLLYAAYSAVVILVVGLVLVWPACGVPRRWAIARTGWASAGGGFLGYLVGIGALGPARGVWLACVPALYGAAIGFIAVRTQASFPPPPANP